MANSNPVWHNIFRYITLKPDNITFEADDYKDTINILRGPGVAWQGTTNLDVLGSSGNDTFMINVDYDISIPLTTTRISLEDVNGNISEVNFKAGRGVAITRNSAQELQWDTYSVTETDTLQTVTDRNPVTNNDIFMNNLQVGTIISSPLEDGFTGYTAGHDLVGDGTLDNPLRFSPTYKDSLIVNNTDQFVFSAVPGGILAYAANYVFDNVVTTASVTLEREDPSNPGTWVVLDFISGTTTDQVYAISGTYADLYNGNVNYRLTFDWTGNTGVATWFTRCTFEAGPLTPIAHPQIKTDTTAKTVLINDLLFFENNIQTTTSNTDIVIAPNGSGRLRVLGDIEAQNLYLDGNITLGDNVLTDIITVNAQFASGTELKTTQTIGDTLNIAAYDTDNTVYRDLITLTAGNSPTLTLVSNGLGSMDNIAIGVNTPVASNFTSIGDTTRGTGKFSDLEATALDNTPIGQTTPSTATFTTSVSGIIINPRIMTYSVSIPANSGAHVIGSYTIAAGVTITQGINSSWVIIDPSQSFSTSVTPTWISVTTNYTANLGDNIYCDTSSGPLTITLPLNVLNGKSVKIASGSSASTNNITVSRNTLTIMGLTEDLIISNNNITVELMYIGSSWRIV